MKYNILMSTGLSSILTRGALRAKEAGGIYDPVDVLHWETGTLEIQNNNGRQL